MKKLLLIVILLLTACSKQYENTYTYQNNNYVLLTYPQDSYTYYFDVEYEEENELVKIEHLKWEAISIEQDIYIIQDQYEQAFNYYNQDQNYDYYLIIDDESKKTITFHDEERLELMNMNKQSYNHSIVFEDIDLFVDVIKVSKDQNVKGILNLVLCDDQFYYKSEIMSEDDREYVIALSSSLNQKLLNVIK